MPAKYQAIRDQMFEKKKAEWKKRHPEQALSSAVKKRLYDESQSSAAKIFNAGRKPGEEPVSGQD
jgi:predicted kinase